MALEGYLNPACGLREARLPPALRGRKGRQAGETLFRNGLRLNTYAAKWDSESAEFADSPLDYTTEVESSLRERVVAAARGAWRAAGARGYLRIDIRCNAKHVPVVLDVNPNPAIGPGVSICRAVEEAGWTWECFVHRQVEWACDR